MQFKIGDIVVLPAHGVGHITEIEEKRFSEQGTRLYYEISLTKRTVWIPVEAHEVSGLRLVTIKKDLDQYRSLLKSLPAALNTNHQRRQLELAGHLKQGSFQGLCEVVRDLTALGWRKPLGQSDTSMLQKTRQSLYQEWAAAADIPVIDAIKEIDSLIQVTRQAYLS